MIWSGFFARGFFTIGFAGSVIVGVTVGAGGSIGVAIIGTTIGSDAIVPRARFAPIWARACALASGRIANAMITPMTSASAAPEAIARIRFVMSGLVRLYGHVCDGRSGRTALVNDGTAYA